MASHGVVFPNVPRNAPSDDGWFTPRWVWDGLGLTFDIDVCVPLEGGYCAPCRKWYSEAEDGLEQPWHGLVWCNPPYSAPTKWCDRFVAHDDGGCLLIRADLSTGGAFRAFTASDAIYVPPQRLRFARLNGDPNKNWPTSSTVLLTRGATCTDALWRLAEQSGGTVRLLGREAA